MPDIDWSFMFQYEGQLRGGCKFFFIIFINAKQDFINKKPLCGTEEKISLKMKNKTKPITIIYLHQRNYKL